MAKYINHPDYDDYSEDYNYKMPASNLFDMQSGSNNKETSFRPREKEGTGIQVSGRYSNKQIDDHYYDGSMSTQPNRKYQGMFDARIVTYNNSSQFNRRPDENKYQQMSDTRYHQDYNRSQSDRNKSKYKEMFDSRCNYDNSSQSNLNESKYQEMFDSRSNYDNSSQSNRNESKYQEMFDSRTCYEKNSSKSNCNGSKYQEMFDSRSYHDHSSAQSNSISNKYQELSNIRADNDMNTSQSLSYENKYNQMFDSKPYHDNSISQFTRRKNKNYVVSASSYHDSSLQSNRNESKYQSMFDANSNQSKRKPFPSEDMYCIPDKSEYRRSFSEEEQYNKQEEQKNIPSLFDIQTPSRNPQFQGQSSNDYDTPHDPWLESHEVLMRNKFYDRSKSIFESRNEPVSSYKKPFSQGRVDVSIRSNTRDLSRERFQSQNLDQNRGKFNRDKNKQFKISDNRSQQFKIGNQGNKEKRKTNVFKPNSSLLEKYEFYPPTAEEMGNLFEGLVIYFFHKVKNVRENNLFVVICESFRRSDKFDNLEVEDGYDQNDPKFRKFCTLRYNGMMMSRGVGENGNLKEPRIWAAVDLINKLSMTCYSLKTKDSYFGNEALEELIRKKEIPGVFRIVLPEEYNSNLIEARNFINSFFEDNNDCELVFIKANLSIKSAARSTRHDIRVIKGNNIGVRMKRSPQYWVKKILASGQLENEMYTVECPKGLGNNKFNPDELKIEEFVPTLKKRLHFAFMGQQKPLTNIYGPEGIGPVIKTSIVPWERKGGSRRTNQNNKRINKIGERIKQGAQLEDLKFYRHASAKVKKRIRKIYGNRNN